MRRWDRSPYRPRRGTGLIAPGDVVRCDAPDRHRWSDRGTRVPGAAAGRADTGPTGLTGPQGDPAPGR
ncbi:hypothetical protein [Pseudonocardia sp. HH130629-09]|uniref:hypothetical protein n=1 Tax=Pseudonocardia sp. HH130629-09 TaxID=1641402 RepID=UPI0011AE768D|nr:hypothetical protein [Pseudonocardia sp. HH130629-09]